MLTFALGSVATTLLGGIVALRVRDRRHLVLGLVAGLMLGAVGFDLIPEALKLAPRTLGGTPGPLVALIAGFLLLHVIERRSGLHGGHENECATHTRSPAIGVLAGAGMVAHSLMDGFAIGAAFQTNSSVGAVVAVAVIAHDFADGFNTYTITALHGADRRRALMFVIADASAPLVGALLTLAVTIPAQVLGPYLGLFAGFLLYLATVDILPEAHADHPTRMTVGATILGAGLIWATVTLAAG